MDAGADMALAEACLSIFMWRPLGKPKMVGLGLLDIFEGQTASAKNI